MEVIYASMRDILYENGIGLLYQVIDVFIDNRMIYWRADKTAKDVNFVKNLAIRKQAEEFKFHKNGCSIFH